VLKSNFSEILPVNCTSELEEYGKEIDQKILGRVKLVGKEIKEIGLEAEDAFPK